MSYGSEKVKHAGLYARLHDYDVNVNFLRMREVLHYRVVVFLGDALRKRADYLYVISQRSRDQLLDLLVVIVVVLNAE